jgi:hypothetical protein
VQLTCCDTETGEEVVDNGPDGGLELQRHPEGLDQPVQGDTNDEDDVQPVDMLVPVLTSDGRVGNMDLLGVSSPRARSVCRLRRHVGGLFALLFKSSNVDSEVYPQEKEVRTCWLLLPNRGGKAD